MTIVLRLCRVGRQNGVVRFCTRSSQPSLVALRLCVCVPDGRRRIANTTNHSNSAFFLNPLLVFDGGFELCCAIGASTPQARASKENDDWRRCDVVPTAHSQTAMAVKCRKATKFVALVRLSRRSHSNRPHALDLFFSSVFVFFFIVTIITERTTSSP